MATISQNETNRLEQFFIRNSILLVIIELGAKLLGLILFVFIARYLGATMTGVYSYGLALTSLFTILPAFGFDRVVQRDVGRNSEEARRLFLEIGSLKVVLSILAFLVILGFMAILGEENSAIISLIAVFVLLLSFNTFINGFFRALGHPELELLNRIVFSLISVGLGIWSLTSGYGIHGVVFSQITAIAISNGLATFILFRKTHGMPGGLRFGSFRRHIIAAAPFALNMGILYLGNQINYVILKIMASETSVGYFSTAYRVFDTITLIPAAVMGAFLPLMSKLHAESSQLFKPVLRFTLNYLLIIATAISVGTWLVGDKMIIALFGTDYGPSGLVIKLMNSSLILSFWNFILTNLLIAVDKEKKLIPVFAFGALAHIVGNVVFIHFFQANGAAMAVISTQFVQLVLLYSHTRKHMRLQDFFHRFPATLASAAVMALATYYVLEINVWLSIGAGALVYLIMLWITGAVKRGDIAAVKRMMSEDTEIVEEGARV